MLHVLSRHIDVPFALNVNFERPWAVHKASVGAHARDSLSGAIRQCPVLTAILILG